MARLRASTADSAEPKRAESRRLTSTMTKRRAVEADGVDFAAGHADVAGDDAVAAGLQEGRRRGLRRRVLSQPVLIESGIFKSERQLRVAHACPVRAVVHARPVTAQRFDVQRRRVPFVQRESVARVLAVEFDEQRVAMHFCDDRRGGDHGAARVAVDERLLRPGERTNPHRIGDEILGLAARCGDGALHREHAGPVDVEPVDFGDAGDADRPRDGARFDRLRRSRRAARGALVSSR